MTIDAQRQAADSATELSALAQLAHTHPELRPTIAKNPAAYPDLLEWLAALGDPQVDAALRQRAALDAATHRATDPHTDAATLAELAYQHPQLRATIAAHSNAYDELKEWIRSAGLTEGGADTTVYQATPAAGWPGAGGGAVSAPVATGPSASAVAPGGSSVYRAAFYVYILGIVATVIASFIVDASGLYSYGSWYFVPVYVGGSANLVAAGLVTIAGFNSPAPSRRPLAGALGAVAIAVSLVMLIAVGAWGGNAALIGSILLPPLLFTSWAVGRPLRGLSYVAIPISIAMSFLVSVGTSPLAWAMPWVMVQIVVTILQVAVVVGTIAIALAFDRASRRRSAYTPAGSLGLAGPVNPYAAATAGPANPYAPAVAPAYHYAAAPPAATNGFAIASLVLGLIGGSVLGVVFGHVAQSQIRRTGQAGSGLAVAGLILNYIWIGVFAIVLVLVLGWSSWAFRY